MRLIKIFSTLFLLLALTAPNANALTFGYTDEALFIEQGNEELKTSQDDMAKITIQLKLAVVDFISRVANHGYASKDSPKMAPHLSGKNLFSYSEIDKSKIEIEISPSKSKHADYFAKIRYIEIFYEGLSASKNPKDCEFYRVTSRRVTELTRYHEGKWHY